MNAQNSDGEHDVWLYRIAIVVLGLTVVASLGGAIALTVAKQPIPEIVVALGSAAIGGLAGFLTPSHSKR